MDTPRTFCKTSNGLFTSRYSNGHKLGLLSASPQFVDKYTGTLVSDYPSPPSHPSLRTQLGLCGYSGTHWADYLLLPLSVFSFVACLLLFASGEIFTDLNSINKRSLLASESSALTLYKLMFKWCPISD
jgi:hypothetical protein